MIQESDHSNLSQNLDDELQLLGQLIGELPVDEKEHSLSPLREVASEIKSNVDALLKLSAAALAQAPGPVQVDFVEAPVRRNTVSAGANLPAVPPSVDPVIVPTTPPIGPPLEAAKTDPSLPQMEDLPKTGAPGLPKT